MQRGNVFSPPKGETPNDPTFGLRARPNTRRRFSAIPMVTKPSLSTPINGALDPFLLESFGVEENGMRLSVLSALARLGLDPWAEAGRLAALPKQAAIAALTRHLGLTGDSTIATRLADLLPDRSAPLLDRPMDRLHGVIRRNVWLWIAVWLGVCVVFLVANAPRRPGTTTEPATSSDSHISGSPSQDRK